MGRGESHRSRQHRRRLPAGQVHLRRRPRARGRGQPRRRPDLECDAPALHVLRGRNVGERRRLPARVGSMGHVRTQRRRVLHQPVAELRRGRRADRQRGAGEQVDRRWRPLERTGDARPKHRRRRCGAVLLQRQGVDHRRSLRLELRLRGLGPGPQAWRVRDPKRGKLVRLPRRHSVLSHDGRREDVGARADDLRAVEAHGHDRQRDRCAAGRNARRRLRLPAGIGAQRAWLRHSG